MIRISYRSFFLGLGVGLILASSANLIIDEKGNDHTVSNSNTFYSVKEEEKDDLFLMIHNDTDAQELYEMISNIGIESSLEDVEVGIRGKTLKKGLYRVNKEMTIEDVFSKITKDNN